MKNKLTFFFATSLFGLTLSLGCYPPGPPVEQNSSVTVNLADGIASAPIVGSVAPEGGVSTQDIVIVVLAQDRGSKLRTIGLTTIKDDFTMEAPTLTKEQLYGFSVGAAKMIFEIYEPSSHKVLKIINVSFQIVG